MCFVKVLLPTLGQKSASQATPLRAGHDTNRHSMSPSGTPATQSDAAPRATIADPSARPDPAQRCERHACHAKNKGRCHLAPRLPTQSDAAPRKIKADPSAPPDPAQRCHQLARLPRQTAVNVTECHASAAQSEAARRATNADPSAPPDPV